MESSPSRLWLQVESSLVVAVFDCQVSLQQHGFLHLSKEGLDQTSGFHSFFVLFRSKKQVKNLQTYKNKHM